MYNEIIKVDNVEYVYKNTNSDSIAARALSDISVKIGKGEFVAVIGRNGSGKSTLARLFNALLLPSKGAVYIAGMDTRDCRHLWDIRKTAGMVFQNPENQIVGTIVEEDIAFGPENLGIEPDEIRNRVDKALDIVGLTEYCKHAPHLLSGGQKQKVAIAGILAMKPECIILDEATAMLDPVSRNEIINVLKELNDRDKITIVHITHHMEEACRAKRVIVMDKGKVVLDGVPEKVFSNVEEIKGLGLDVPQIVELFYELNKYGSNLPLNVLEIKAAVAYILEEIKKGLPEV